MLYLEHPPHPGLKRHIRCFWTMELSDAPQDHEMCFLAEGLECAFFLGDETESPGFGPKPGQGIRAWVSGPMTCTTRITPAHQTKVFGICFRPGGAYPFFPHPVSELMNTFAGLDDLWESKGLDLAKIIQDERLATWERMDLLNHYFLQKLDENHNNEGCIHAAVDLMQARKGDVTIDTLADVLGLGRRQLERKFRERVGMTPKQLCRSLRFKNLFRYVSTAPGHSWAETASAFGYYDQSHMIREFKHYTGQSPATYIEKPDSMERFFMGNF